MSEHAKLIEEQARQELHALETQRDKLLARVAELEKERDELEEKCGRQRAVLEKLNRKYKALKGTLLKQRDAFKAELAHERARRA